MSHLYIQETLKQLDIEIETLTGHLTKGSYNELSQYKYVCGQVRGLETARELIKSTASKLDGEDYD
jgi:hypothetical protein